MSSIELDPARRRELRELLATVVRASGWEHFVLAPIVEPDDRFFPDRAYAGVLGVEVVANRLLAHARLWDELRCTVRDRRPRPAVSSRTRPRYIAPQHTDLQAQVIERRGDARAKLRITVVSIGDAPSLVDALAFEVARALVQIRRLGRAPADPYRALDGSSFDDDALHRLARAAVVYLGFGALALTNEPRPGSVRSHHLDDDLAFMLAAQLVARGADPETVEHLRGRLHGDASRALAHWVDALAPEAALLREELSVPDPSTWPAPLPIASEPGDLRPERVAAAEAYEARRHRADNRGRRVFRLRDDQAGRFTVLGVLAGAPLGLLAFHHGAPGWLTLLAQLSCGAVGWLVGRQRRDDRCSDRACDAPLAPDVDLCARCGGEIAGEIATPDERLDAEEALRERGRSARSERRPTRTSS